MFSVSCSVLQCVAAYDLNVCIPLPLRAGGDVSKVCFVFPVCMTLDHIRDIFKIHIVPHCVRDRHWITIT